MKKVHEDKRYGKRSFQAMNLAKDVISRINSKSKINLRELHVSNGYSKNSAIAQKGLHTKSFQSLIVPVINQLEEVRAKSLNALLKKDLDKEKYRDLIEGVDKLTKNTQLLSGKSTENIANNIVVFGEDDFLSKQVNT